MEELLLDKLPTELLMEIFDCLPLDSFLKIRPHKISQRVGMIFDVYFDEHEAQCSQQLEEFRKIFPINAEKLTDMRLLLVLDMEKLLKYARLGPRYATPNVDYMDRRWNCATCNVLQSISKLTHTPDASDVGVCCTDCYRECDYCGASGHKKTFCTTKCCGGEQQMCGNCRKPGLCMCHGLSYTRSKHCDRDNMCQEEICCSNHNHIIKCDSCDNQFTEQCLYNLTVDHFLSWGNEEHYFADCCLCDKRFCGECYSRDDNTCYDCGCEILLVQYRRYDYAFQDFESDDE